MRRLLVWFVVSLVPVVWSCLTAGAEPTADEYMKFFEPIVGDWDVTTQVDGKTVSGQFSCTQSAAKQCLIERGSGLGPFPGLEGVSGYDPRTKKWRSLFFMANGETSTRYCSTAKLDPNGTRFDVERRNVSADGKTSRDRAVWVLKYVAGQKVELQVTDFQKDGQKQPDMLWTFVRRQAAKARTATVDEFREFARTIRGRFVGEVTWVADWPGYGKRGEKVTAYWEGRLSDDGRVLLGRFHGGPGSETSMVFYDSAARQIRWIGASSGGMSFDSVVFKLNGKWTQEGKGSTPDGSETKSTSTLTMTDNGNTHTWTGPTTVAGKRVDDQKDVWRRIGR